MKNYGTHGVVLIIGAVLALVYSVAGTTASYAAPPQVWDAATDYSDTQNPVSDWGFGIADGGQFTSVFDSHTSAWIPSDWTNCPGWFMAGNPNDQHWNPGGLCRSNGTFSRVPGAAPAGRLVSYGNVAVKWTAPRSMTIDICGDAFNVRTESALQLIVKGQTLFTVPLFSGRPHTNPYTFVDGVGGDVSKLRNIQVNAGDTVVLLLGSAVSAYQALDYVGFDLIVTETGSTLGKLFPTSIPEKDCYSYYAEGYTNSVCGVAHTLGDTVTNGMALGGVDTGCIDLETTGLLGYCTAFNTHVPRRGPINLPILGLSVGGDTWVLCSKTPKQGQGELQVPVIPVLSDLSTLSGVKTATEIHYWGHYPVADMEFDTDAPVSVGLRAWSPFLPGDVTASMIPAAIFEVHLRNTSESSQTGSIAFSFPGPVPDEAGATQFSREQVNDSFKGVVVSAPLAGYSLGVIGGDSVRTGGELGANGAAWAGISSVLPVADASKPGSSVAVDFSLGPGESKVVRYVLTWCAPKWNGAGYNWANWGHTFTHMYAKYYSDAEQTAQLIAANHESLLKRVIAWQQVIYTEDKLPTWLRDSLINSLYLITEDGMWAQKKSPLPEWVREEDGLFGMNECPRGCSQIECIPCSFYGSLPLAYFFPELQLSTIRGYKGYQYADGCPPWTFTGFNGGRVEFADPTRGYQWASNGISLAAIVDRFLMCRDDANHTLLNELYPTIKQNMIWTMNLRTTPSYTTGQKVISMPDANSPEVISPPTEWFEAPSPGWAGMTAHIAGLHLAQLRIVQRMAQVAGDTAFYQQCSDWITAGAQAMESFLWTTGPAGSYYLNYYAPDTGQRSDLIFGYQMDGEWITDHHGLPSALPQDCVLTTLDTIKRCNVAATKYGAVNYTNSDGSVANPGGYGSYSYFPPEALMLAMNYMYEGQKDFGLQLAGKVWKNLTCIQGYTWDMPNIMRGDVDTGERTFGNDYYQDMMIWSLPAAMEGQTVDAPTKPGGLVDRVMRASAALETVGSISGKVTDASNGLPVSGATITLARANSLEVTTGTDGNYTFSSVQAGSYVFTISKPGWYSQTCAVGILAGIALEKDIRLMSIPVAPHTWDAAADYSDVRNPVSDWDFGIGSGGQFAGVFDRCASAWIPSDWTNCPGWFMAGDPNNQHWNPGGLCKSNGTFSPVPGAAPAGRLVGYGNVVIKWTAPRAATINISGCVYNVRTSSALQLVVNGSTKFAVPFLVNRPYTNPYTFAEGMGANASRLQNILVSPGDIVVLLMGSAVKGYQALDYVGFGMTIQEQAVVTNDIHSVKSIGPGWRGQVKGIVSATYPDFDSFYIEASDRSCALKVCPLRSPAPALGDEVIVSGEMLADGSILSTGCALTGINAPVGPLGVSNKNLASNTCLNNACLLVKTWGKIIDDPLVLADGTKIFHIDDGSSSKSSPLVSVPTAFLDTFDDAKRVEWVDAAGASTVSAGQLITDSNPSEVVVGGLSLQNGTVSVDFQSGKHGGLLTRFKDTNSFILAFFSSAQNTMAFHEKVNGNWGGWLAPVAVSMITGATVHMTLQVSGNQATATVTDGVHTQSTTITLSTLLGSGLMGIYHDNGTGLGMQYFDNFAVQMPGITHSVPSDVIEVIIPPSAAGAPSTAKNDYVSVLGIAGKGLAANGSLRSVTVRKSDDIVGY